MSGLELDGVVPRGLSGVRLDASEEGALLAVQAELADRAELGEEGVPLVASRQPLHACISRFGGGRGWGEGKVIFGEKARVVGGEN